MLGKNHFEQREALGAASSIEENRITVGQM